MKTRALGGTGASVSIIGLGAGALGDLSLSEDAARDLVSAALDLGVTLFDTAKSYGASEERLGRYLGARRKDVLVATKGGYGVESCADWTPDAIRLGIDAALAHLRTNYLDVFFFHSCPLSTLCRDDLLAELDRAKQAGKIRFAGYSGENEELAWAASSGRFDVLECSVSVLDRSSLPMIAETRLGVIAKRPLANAPWRFSDPPERGDIRVYWDRMRELGVDLSPELAIRFAAHAPFVSSAIVGTSSVQHLASAVRAASEGPLDRDVLDRLPWRSDWRGVV
jgi:aryl-alcohol dehydrogenase-like predicted oxidoreductase